MLGFKALQLYPPQFFSSKSKPIPQFLKPNFIPLSTTHLKPQPLNPKKPQIYAKNGENDAPLPTENGNNGADEGKSESGRPRFNLKWLDLVLDPDPDNIAAVGLTGLLTWASVQVLWQLFVISAAILLAALKYTIVAALLIFILITLL
ncbi:hypothetical protein CASFOL_012823 [Castilleja foliolosa]|uniref:Transmembrane protein n=1 Tax=Castilleja foliolosa TaxID=1961234 RepID=A0ABD3DIB4_9LAMI